MKPSFLITQSSAYTDTIAYVSQLVPKAKRTVEVAGFYPLDLGKNNSDISHIRVIDEKNNLRRAVFKRRMLLKITLFFSLGYHSLLYCVRRSIVGYKWYWSFKNG